MLVKVGKANKYLHVFYIFRLWLIFNDIYLAFLY